jgi:hypothetical protein
MSVNILNSLKGRHAGEKVAFLGTGTSLLDFDLSLLRDDIRLVAFNRFIPFCFSYWPHLKLDYYMVHDPAVFNMSFKKFKAIPDSSGNTTVNPDSPSACFSETVISDFILNDSRVSDTSIILCHDIPYPAAKRFGILQNKEWLDKNSKILEGRNVFTYPRSVESIDSEYFALSGKTKNSFCGIGLSMLCYMGFSEIYLFGVDYGSDGHFYNIEANQTIYIPKEYQDFSDAMSLVNNLKHSPKVFSARSKKTYVEAKDGFIDFENLC